MTLEEANKIMKIWGKYLEHTFGRLNTLFMGKIPESLLPYNKTVLDEALNIMDKHYFDTGNKRGMELMRETIILLELYHDDDEMLQHAGKMFNDPNQRENIVASIKDWQNTWLTTQ